MSTFTCKEGDCQCGECQKELTPVSEKVTEQLDIQPARVRVLRHVRKTYACQGCNGNVVTVPMPNQPIPRGLAHWMVKAGELVQPLINMLRERLLAYDIVAMEETQLQVLKEPGKRAESQSYLWVQRGGPPDHPILLYDYDSSRSQRVPIRLLEGFCGYLLTDGYEAYGKVCAAYGLTAVGCWAHARRKFDEAIKARGLLGPETRKASLAGVAMAKIQHLYRIERETNALSAAERQRIRQERALPLLEDIRCWLDEHLPVVPPRSAHGKVMNYAHKQWPKLTVYVEDGRLRIGNNLTENAIRPFVIGRKNLALLRHRGRRQRQCQSLQPGQDSEG